MKRNRTPYARAEILASLREHRAVTTNEVNKLRARGVAHVEVFTRLCQHDHVHVYINAVEPVLPENVRFSFLPFSLN